MFFFFSFSTSLTVLERVLLKRFMTKVQGELYHFKKQTKRNRIINEYIFFFS
jgi:hypothetical protein